MECKGCGRQIQDESVFCQYCGHSITGQARPALQQAQAKSGMSVGMIIVVVIVAMVLISVVLAAVLYIMVLGFSGPSINTPSVVYQKKTWLVDNDANGVQMNIVSITDYGVSWSDVLVVLTDGTYGAEGTNFAEWSPLARDLDGGSWTYDNLGATALGDIGAYCWVVDISGDGYVSRGDYIQVFTATGATTFSSATTYTLVLIYEPTAAMMGTGITFTGQS